MTIRSTAVNRRRRVLKDGLSAETVNELRYKRENARESEFICGDSADYEGVDEWRSTIAAITAVLVTPTVKTLSLHPIAQTELDNSITSDMPSNERRMIIRDLCRAGWFPEKNPSSVCTRSIKTVRVDGKLYEVGSYE